MRLTTRELTLLGACIAILFVQEQVLTFLPNIQFTTLLLFVYSRVFKTRKTLIIILIHVILDNLYMGSIGMINIVVPMFIAWSLIPITLNSIFSMVKSEKKLAIIGYFYGHIYGLVYVPFQAFILEVNIKTYIIADIPFEIIMGVSNFVTILWLFDVLRKVLSNEIRKYSI